MNDKDLIEKLGGVKVISDTLGYNYNTVHNWLTRGISRNAKIDHPEVFMPKSSDDVKPLKNHEEA